MPDLRPISPADAARCAEIARASIFGLASAYSPGQQAAWADRFTAERMAELIADSYALGAFQGERLAGFGMLSAPMAEIGYLYVEPDAAGQGLGAALMLALLAEARAHRLAAVSLTASLNAVEFYERFGFARGEPGERCLGVESLGCLRMTCRL